jgi:hypothetical protein
MSRTKGAHGKHKKEKPVKEKKKRGRPSKQHQHQQQKQVVNVNVNGGGGGGGGNKTIPVPFQLPSTIYDPSLITPHYGINDRQPVNPLTDAATDLMTPFIQSLISNQAQKVDRIPIKDAVKPVNPVIPKPPPQTIPVPQTDQSHPIPPDIIIDSDIQLPMHNKHMYNKNLQNMLQPQVPKNKPPKIIKDPEGLGKRIPIENIGTLAANIGAAALTGGATAAGEALVMGGTAGLMGAGESILGATIGSGVATGVSTALGNSEAGHIISGVAGGIAGRAAGRRIANKLRNRNIQNEESQSLLSSSQGQRLGGRRGQSRLVPPEIQGVVSPEETMSSIKRIANKTMKNASETVSNLRTQISEAGDSIMGTIRRRGRPRSSVFPKSDDNLIEDVEGRMRWDNEMRQNELQRNATNRLTAAIKRKKEENTIGFKKINNENDQLMETLENKLTAATKIKDAIRRGLPLNTATQKLKTSMVAFNKNGLKQLQDEIKDLSAEEIQRFYRDYKTRKQIRQDKINKGREILRQNQYNTYLQDEAATNFGTLSKGALKQQKKALQQALTQVQGQQILKDIKSENTAANFEFMSGDVLRQQRKAIQQQIKQKKETKYNQIGAAKNKYDKIVEMMATRNETPMVLGETAPSRFIQSAARLRKKALQSEISHVDSRVQLATKQQKEARIQKANLGISRMDNIIKKKTAAGRPRTRSDQEAAASSTATPRRNSRLYMLSSTSTLGSSTPTRTPKKK